MQFNQREMYMHHKISILTQKRHLGRYLGIIKWFHFHISLRQMCRRPGLRLESVNRENYPRQQLFIISKAILPAAYSLIGCHSRAFCRAAMEGNSNSRYRKPSSTVQDIPGRAPTSCLIIRFVPRPVPAAREKMGK